MVKYRFVKQYVVSYSGEVEANSEDEAKRLALKAEGDALDLVEEGGWELQELEVLGKTDYVTCRQCLECGHTFTGPIYHDKYGYFMSCPSCGGSFDIDLNLGDLGKRRKLNG